MNNYRKGLIMIVCLIFSTAGVMAFYSVSYNCENDVCIEGRAIEWNITVTNNGENLIRIIAMEIMNSFNHSQIAVFNATHYPHSDNLTDFFNIPVRTKRSKIIKARVPEENSEGKLVYYLCFTRAVNEQALAKDNIYTLRHCYSERTEILPIGECIYNFTCRDDEYCLNNRCVGVNCNECQYIASHRCLDYECCSSSQCEKRESCQDNVCVALNCSEQEYFFNHTCVQLDCAEDEGIINHTCVQLDCAEDEGIINHTCKKLGCTYEEIIINHTCVNLNCSEDEFIADEGCRKLDCMFNETAINHSCIPLECHFFQKIANHRCINNKPFIVKLSIELLIIAIIVILTFIDIRWYEIIRKPKLKVPKDLKEDKKKVR